MLIDHQAHWYPTVYLDSILDRERFPRTHRRDGGGYVFEFDDEPLGNTWQVPAHYFDLDAQLADMDANGIDFAVISPNLVGDLTRVEPAEARESLELLNEETARVVREHPDRLCGLAMLPMQDPAAAIEVLDRAIGELGLSGVCVISNVAGEPIASPERLPVYQRIEEHGVPILLHPSNRSLAFETIRSAGRATEVGLAWMFETSSAPLSLIFSGTFDACPRLQVVHPHGGGVLPYIVKRLEAVQRLHRVKTERSVPEYLRTQVLIDSANPTPGALELAARTYGSDRILYASDYPWVDRPPTLRFLDEQVEPELAAQVRRNRLAGLAPAVRG